jgi:uncharacterized protein
MFVLALEVELHLPGCTSLKAKRAVLKPVVEGCRQRFGADVAEIDHQDLWQRAAIGVAVVAGSAAHAAERADAIERWLWSRPGHEVLGCERHWLEVDR